MRLSRIAVVASALVVAAPLAAQTRVSLDIAYRRIGTNADPMPDAHGVHVMLRRAGRQGAIWIGAERLTSGQARHGIPCGGFIPPGDECGPEPLTDEARMVGGELGVSFTLRPLRWLDVEPMFAWRVDRVKATTRGSSGKELRGEGTPFGPEIGMSAAIDLAPRIPAVVVSVRSAGLGQVGDCLDCYDPFRGMVVKTLQVGLRWPR